VLVDSHCHLDMLDYDKLGLDLDGVIAAAKAQGVERILTIGVDLQHAQRVIDIANQYDEVFASVGLHPSEKVDVEPTIEDFLPLATQSKVIAIGEMGLDYYYNDSGLENQRERFRQQIRLAREVNKPIIIHTRQAPEDTITIMREEGAEQVGGVMHCFTESIELAQQALELGFYISFSGIVTFKNAQNVRDVLDIVPLDRILVETDAPYLTPVPYRGKPNQPGHVSYVAAKVAELKQVDVETLASTTTANFQRCFFRG
jgi:TatD DNase family protein